MPLSIEESIKKLKAEIIAQDWRISPKRAAGLEDAFGCLRQRFKNRRATHAMLIMAGSVLDYIKKRGGDPPETIDFLKESMAHVVNLYEDLTFDPEKEELLFDGLFKRFQRLKGKIKVGGGKTADLERPPVSQPVKDVKDELVDEAVAPPVKVESLIEDLRSSLDKAGEASIAIGRILTEAMEPQGGQFENETKPVDIDKVSLDVIEQKKDRQDRPLVPPHACVCPPTEVREFVINGIDVVIPSEIISLIRPLKTAKLKDCLRTSQVPLKYFAGFMKGLACQFKGGLAEIKDKRLKKVILPIVIPEGFAFADKFDPEASTLVIISDGNWYGVLLCSEIKEEISMMKKITKQKNGDIAGLAHLDDGREVMLLDTRGILRREGFLLMT